MGINKECIEHLELGLGTIQEGLQWMEEALHRISSVMITNQENPNHDNRHQEGNNGGRHIVSSKLANLEFSHFSGDDPTEWFNQVEQFFEY